MALDSSGLELVGNGLGREYVSANFITLTLPLSVTLKDSELAPKHMAITLPSLLISTSIIFPLPLISKPLPSPNGARTF